MAKEIAKSLSDCELAAIHIGMSMTVPEGLERIGFVYPTYGWATPLMVADFFRKANFPKQGETYFFAVATCGGLALNAVPAANALLAERGVTLNYGAKITMFKNSVLNYDMNKQVEKIATQSSTRAMPIIRDVVNKRIVKIKPVNQLLFRLHLDFMKQVPETAMEFQVNSECMACGLCAKLCPSQNIKMANGKPIFNNKCERCLSCLQHCPKRAINYKDKTQNRRRYIHPKIKHGEIATYYK